MGRTVRQPADTKAEDALFARVAEILDESRGLVARTINTAMVQAYWLVGREIVLVEQAGRERATYGDKLIGRLSARLTPRFGPGFTASNLTRMRQFYLAFPEGSALPEIRASARHESSANAALQRPSAFQFSPNLSWTHYRVLITVPRKEARAFYEIEAAREAWSVRELERQIGTFLFERISRNKPDAIRSLASEGQEVQAARDVIKDPFVLEFLELREHAGLHERDIEQAIIDRMESFLLELGKGFCFIGRQKRITVEGDHFYVDLVFYNRLLRAFVLVDLKLGKLTHQDLGQMQMYVNYYDRYQRAEHEARTIGIVLCSEKNDAMVKITLPEGNEQIVAARYLPTEEELRRELTREREVIERARRLEAG